MQLERVPCSAPTHDNQRRNHKKSKSCRASSVICYATTWRLNNGIIARIKHDTQNHCEEFEVEESIRQGGGLSAIFYGQHVGCVVEDLEKKNFGKQIGDVKIPAVAWQDDVTLIPKDKKEESDMITEFEHSTDENRIKLAIKKKTKVLTVGKADHEITVMKGKVLTETEEAKVLGYTYNNKGNANTHLDNKESEAVSMMANMGLSVSETNMDRIYLPSLLIIHKKCFIHKLLYGLAGILYSIVYYLLRHQVVRIGFPICTPVILYLVFVNYFYTILHRIHISLLMLLPLICGYITQHDL